MFHFVSGCPILIVLPCVWYSYSDFTKYYGRPKLDTLLRSHVDENISPFFSVHFSDYSVVFCYGCCLCFETKTNIHTRTHAINYLIQIDFALARRMREFTGIYTYYIKHDRRKNQQQHQNVCIKVCRKSTSIRYRWFIHRITKHDSILAIC